MFSEKDKSQVENRGSELQTVQGQIDNFKKGFPYLHIEDAASVGNGIIRLNKEELTKRVDLYDSLVSQNIKPLKFIPASGAASRMFKTLFEALEALKKGNSEKQVFSENKAAKEFTDKLEKFAFNFELENVIDENTEEKSGKNQIDFLLNNKGLNYGSLPKGLLKFHSYENGARTPFEEHLVEGAKYAKDSNGIAKLHFTI